MNEIVNQLAQSLFKKNSLQECSRWELEILADHYPYFGIAQFLVTGKLKDENAETFGRQLEKTSLYFTNPLWLDYVINNQTPPSEDILERTEFTETENAGSIPVEAKEIVPEDIPEAGRTAEIIEGVSQIEDEPIIPRENLPAPSVQSSSENEQYDTDDTDDEENTDMAENPEEELKMRPFQFGSLPESELKSPLAFEPYHTVDYFASQGIKMVPNEKPKDRFEQQLKSFTQWLKTIKKVPVAEIAKETGTDSEQKVITLAEHSIEDREIVTEAMAEVWTKQGNREKAIEVYLKLSLQNPAKSSYFAGLIEQLKQ
ncbi:MAG: hypothetical protein JWM28_1191 [Chitinophagaceae bacterium]|nr:hypothetical protein [Chitinophagaceae bacterium]